jgi:membrane protease YdiL (CAAX protease family)
MKKIWKFITHHVNEDFNSKHYSVVLLWLIIAITINYTFSFEEGHLKLLTGLRKYFAYFAFYSIAYFPVIISYSFFYNKASIFKEKTFWLKSIFIIAVLSLDSSIPFLLPLVESYLPLSLQYWGYKVIVNLISLFTVVLPIFIFYCIIEKKTNHYYGLQLKHVDLKPYFIMLLIMFPLLLTASFDESFLKQYPMYKTSSAHLYLEVPEWVTVAIYELAYGLDFITVELLFRGFLVIGMLSVLGRGGVLAMAVVYCFLHFSKPAGEAISSIAGGYILGVVAYETRSIWGGIIVHMGIAWMMELLAFIQKSQIE